MLGKTYHTNLDRVTWRTKDGFKLSKAAKRIKEVGHVRKHDRRMQLNQVVGVTIQMGERNVETRPQAETRTAISVTIGELIRYKSPQVVDRESNDGTD